jgi:hypothetical protein
LIEDGSQAQWFIDGQAAFEVIASSIENAKSEVYFFIFSVLTHNAYNSCQCLFLLTERLKTVCRYSLLGGGFAQNCI